MHGFFFNIIIMCSITRMCGSEPSPLQSRSGSVTYMSNRPRVRTTRLPFDIVESFNTRLKITPKAAKEILRNASRKAESEIRIHRPIIFDHKLSRDISHIHSKAFVNSKVEHNWIPLTEEGPLLKSLLDSHFNEIYKQKQILTNINLIEDSIKATQIKKQGDFETTPRESIMSIGRPPGRIECIILNNWVDDKLNSNDNSDSLSYRKLIYDFSLLEIIRQNSIQCQERGALLKRLIEGVRDYYEK